MIAFCAFGVQTVLIGLFVAPRLKRYQGAHTLGDIMETHYGRSARLVTGVLSVLLCAGILGAQALAIGTVVNATLDVPTAPSVLIGMGVVVLYSSFGGAWAVIRGVRARPVPHSRSGSAARRGTRAAVRAAHVLDADSRHARRGFALSASSRSSSSSRRPPSA